MDRCDVYDAYCKDCVRDPYCRWSTSENKCLKVDAVSSNGRLADVERESKESVRRRLVCFMYFVYNIFYYSSFRPFVAFDATR